jgi:YbbR domain-containing protein
VNRALAFLVRNWPLKLAAIALATLLYAGVAFTQEGAIVPGPVEIVPRNVPDDVVVLPQELPAVTDIRYSSPGDIGPLRASDFEAWVDLADVDPASGPQSVDVNVRALVPGVLVTGFEPPRVAVDLDPFIDRVVPVVVERGQPPAGLEVGIESVEPAQVAVSGPKSVVDQVVHAVASVTLDATGLNFDGEVEPVPVDANGNRLSPVDVTPATVRVSIPVFNDRQTRTLPVNPVVTGTPAAGHRVAAVMFEPVTVRVEGDADALEGLTAADTNPVPVGGAVADVVADVAFALPDGVVALQVDTVHVTVQIEEVSETRTFGAGLRTTGAQPGLSYELSTDRVLVTLFGPVAALDEAQQQPLVATVDVSALEPGSTEVPVTIGAPAGLTVADVSPQNVTVTAVPVATPTPGVPAPSLPAATPTPTPAP